MVLWCVYNEAAEGCSIIKEVREPAAFVAGVPQYSHPSLRNNQMPPHAAHRHITLFLLHYLEHAAVLRPQGKAPASLEGTGRLWE